MCVSTISDKSCWKKFFTSTQGCHWWHQRFSCWERWQLHRIGLKLPLQIDPFCPCLCCFLASYRGIILFCHYLVDSYIRSFSHFLCHFMIESWGWSLLTLSWSDFPKWRALQNWLYTAQDDVSQHCKIAKTLLSNLLNVVKRNLTVILQCLINACMLVDCREIYSVTESRHF